MSNPATPRPEALKKLAQLQIERLKREEEEEQWISGEELYTEGSSDEDDTALRSKIRKSNEGVKRNIRNLGKIRKPGRETKSAVHNSSIPKVNVQSCGESLSPEQINQMSLEDKNSTTKGTEEIVPDENAAASSSIADDDDEFKEEISWRPKRGSIKLPNLTTEGSEDKKLQPLLEAEKAYLMVVKRVNKLKRTISEGYNNSYSLSKAIVHASVHGSGIHCSHALSDGSVDGVPPKDWSFLKESGDIHSAFLSVQRLDALISAYDVLAKKSHEETMSTQMELRKELDKLRDGPSNGELAKNTACFRQLCLFLSESTAEDDKLCITDRVVGVDDSNTDATNFEQQLAELQNFTSQGTSDVQREMYLRPSEDTNEGHETTHDGSTLNTKDKNFIERNIKLAHEGMGVLSVTDDEKKRLANLLEDLEDVKVIESGARTFKENIKQKPEHEGFSVSQETQRIISDIDSRLDVYVSYGSEDPTIKSLSLLPDKYGSVKDCETWLHSKQRLHALDLLLSSATKPILNEIEPLTEEQIKYLSEVSTSSLLDNRKATEETSQKCLTEADKTDGECRALAVQFVDHNTIKELVEQAKLGMPLFKFKHNKSDEIKNVD